MKDNDLEYEIYGSSSKGNCVRINDVMVDIGLPFSAIHEALYKVKYILLTHIHSDHVKPSTYRKIRALFPNIKIVGNWEVSQKFPCDEIINAGYPLKIGGYIFNAFEAPHNVLVYGYYWTWYEKEIVYVTDTYSLENVPEDMKFDYMFLEANHDERKIEQIENKTYGYDAYAGARRHLSIQQAKAFYLMHKKPDAMWLQLHKSSRFY